MDNAPSPETNDHTNGTPEPEVLKPRADDGTPVEGGTASSTLVSTHQGDSKPHHHRTYRPSHKATFIGLAAVVIILAINAGILGFVLKGKTKTNNHVTSGQVTISSSTLSKIGVNSSPVGNSGIVLQVGPNAQFNGSVTVAGTVNVAGQLKLNSTFFASSANITQLEAGDTSLSQLDVNGSSTLTSLSLRNDLAVAGTTELQGDVVVSQLLTVDGGLNVAGNLSVGGVFSTKSFSASSLTSTSTLTIEGHVISGGSAPSVGPGSASALGNNGTVSISGDDSAGTIDINIGTGTSANGGVLAKLAFANQYTNTPRITISPVIDSSSTAITECSFYVLSPSISGFSVEDSCGLPPGGYAIDYIVEQ